jgi:hypothetical protein
VLWVRCLLQLEANSITVTALSQLPFGLRLSGNPYMELRSGKSWYHKAL